MITQFNREEILLGTEAMNVLKNSHVAIFGVGGVGGYVAEALVRGGVGALDFIDNDVVSLTNINRQIIALHSTLGKSKVEVMKERAIDINPEVKIITHNCFYLPENAGQFDFKQYDYVVDAVDTVSAKIALAEQAHEAGTPIISAMGAGKIAAKAIDEALRG
jgi:tRNA A37 threonylcarbamoyladenosine dehydratase